MSHVSHDNTIVVHSHILKNAGSTIVSLLRRNYGIAHLDVIPRMNAGLLQYTSRELGSDLRRFPWIRSISGHNLYPWENYGELSSRLLWFIFLRDPVQRFLSQYEFQVTRYGLSGDFWEWKRKYRRDNQQVVHLAGEPDLEAAKQVLRTKVSAFGIVERFDESLLIIRQRLGLIHLNLTSTGAKNVSRGSLKKIINDNYDKYREAIEECNHLDMLLYDYAVNVPWPEQVEKYGEADLQRDRSLVFDNPKTSLKEAVNEKVNRVFRHCVYRPLTWTMSQIGHLL